MATSIDSVEELPGTPPIVHISDIHGYLDEAQSALLAVGEISPFDPIVELDESGTLHWADNEYVLIFNGDMIDRGPDSEACLNLVWRLMEEAPAGHVRYNLGNHEMSMLLPSLFSWPDVYSTNVSADMRRDFLSKIEAGTITAAFEGYNYTYNHAGTTDPVEPAMLNQSLREASSELLAAPEAGLDPSFQKKIERSYPRLFKLGENGGRGPSAGILWLDFAHLEKSAPPQIVGHTQKSRAVRKGNVVCGNVIRMNLHSDHGEGVLYETSESLTYVYRERDGSTYTMEP